MRSAKSISLSLLGGAFLSGGVSAFLWLSSDAAWDKHLTSARIKGERLYDYAVFNRPLPDALSSTPLSPEDNAKANTGRFEQISNLPQPALVTFLSLGTGPLDIDSGPTLRIAAISPKLRYPLSQLSQPQQHGPHETLGAMTELMARYCSDAQLLLNTGTAGWHRVSADTVWACDAAPADRRLLAVLLAILCLIAGGSVVINLTSTFSSFAETLNNRLNHTRTKTLQLHGPLELRAIIAAVNRDREVQRRHLEERAVILSGVSHDLGTPATRLRLRAATITDQELRSKIVADIDQMTGIIESVLTYTRAELSTEEPRALSLSSLVEAIVADYADVGSPVSFETAQRVIVDGAQSIFMSRRGRNHLPDDSPLVASARPLALRRAITNLIDNALKYGRRATVRLEADAQNITILIEDEGGALSAEELDRLTLPFQRGDNAQTHAGFGLGLTIVSSIAIEHGGDLTFMPGSHGTIAQLRIPRL